MSVWPMIGMSRNGSGKVITPTPATGFNVVAVTNAIGHAEPELNFQNGTQTDEWDLTARAEKSNGSLSVAVPTGWDIVGPH